MRLIRIVGLGNAMAGDDGIGIRAIEAICNAGWEHVQTLALSIPGPEMFDGLNGDDLLILIDGCRSGAAAGTVHDLNVDEVGASGLRHGSTHVIGLADWIALAMVSGETMPEMRVYGVEIGQCGMGEVLSAAVADAVPELLRRVRESIHLHAETIHA